MSAGQTLSRARTVRARDQIALARFFAELTVKEHIWPTLHVRPLVAELFLTDNCNLKCVSCACWRETTTDELTTSEWKDVLGQLRELGILKLNFTGGEALIRRDAIGLFDYASELGFGSLHLNTNGILLSPKRLEPILDAGVRSFNISIDGPGALHDEIRGRVGAFERTTRHLRHLIGLRDPLGPKVRMNFTVMRTNVHALCDVMRLAQELEVRLYLNLATDRTFLFRHQEISELSRVTEEQLQAALAEAETLLRADRRWLPRFSDLRYMRGHFSDVIQRDLPCAESQLKLMVHSRGEIGGCWGHDPLLNVRTTRVREIVDGAEYRDEHARLFRKDCSGCGSNYSLNLRWRPSTYVRDALWRAHRLTLGDP